MPGGEQEVRKRIRRSSQRSRRTAVGKVAVTVFGRRGASGPLQDCGKDTHTFPLTCIVNVIVSSTDNGPSGSVIR